MCAVCLAYLMKAVMPVTYFNKQCPGVHSSQCCAWSTEAVGERALILSTNERCPICTVMQGLQGDVRHLQLHLANLYLLDTDQFRKAREGIGDDVFKEVQVAVLDTLISGISSLKVVRGGQPKICVVRSIDLLIQVSRLLKHWGCRLVQDTYEISQCEAAIGMFATTVRGLIYEFVCSDAWQLCAHLCIVKRHVYHMVDQSLLLWSWQSVQDFGIVNAYVHYLCIARNIHKHNLHHVKENLIIHDECIKRNGAMTRRGVFVKRAIGLLDSMMTYRITLPQISL